MDIDVSFALIQSVIDSQKDLIVIFEGDKPVLTNRVLTHFSV